MNGSPNDTSKEREIINKTESIVFGIIMWTLFLPMKLAFLTLKSDKRKVPLIFLTVFVIYAYSLAVINSVGYVSDAIDFRRDVIMAMINDRVDPLEQSELCLPAQNIPDVFSVTPVGDGVAIYYPGAYTGDPLGESDDTNDILATLKSDSAVFITQSGEKFHLEGCRHLNGAGKEITYKTALMYGYSPCKVCFGK